MALVEKGAGRHAEEAAGSDTAATPNHLSEQGLCVSATGVAVLLGEERVACNAVVEIVKWRRQKYGACAEAFYASMESFVAFANARRGDGCTLKFAKVTAA